MYVDLITQPKRQFLSDVITDQELDKLRPGSFNILRAPRGWGKTTFMFDDRILRLARNKKNVCYLVHTKTLRDSICEHYPDYTRVLTDKDADGWLSHRKKSLWTIEDDVCYIRVMCYQTFAAILRHDTEWLQDIDLVIWDEFDDITQYYNQEIKNLKKFLPDLNSQARAASILEEGKSSSVVAFVYQIHQYILDPARIILIAISATPEIAAQLFSDRVNYVLNGRLEEIYDARFTYYINSIAEYFKQGIVTPRDDMCPWIYTPRVRDILRLAEICRSYGFKVLTLWSADNPDWRDKMTEEIKAAMAHMAATGMVPEEYNCVITNQVMGRGVDIYDTRFQDWFCDSNQYVDIAQFIRARYQPENKYLLTGSKGLIEFVRSDTHFPECYYQWHYKEELMKLLTESPIYNKTYERQLPNWSQVQKEWGDTIKFEERKYGTKHLKQYRVVGLLAQGTVT